MIKFRNNISVEGKIFKPSIFPQRNNPVYQFEFEEPVLCFYCETKVTSSRGRKKKWTSLNKLHAHCSYDHKTENFRDYLIGLATKIIKGELK